MRQMNFREELAKLTPVLRNNINAKIYIFGAGQIWKGIRVRFINTVNIDMLSEICAFVDNDPQKQGGEFMGKPVIAPQEMDEDSIVMMPNYHREIFLQLTKMNILRGNRLFTCDYFNYILMRFCNEETSSFKNKHFGERCFIIGNGSSLSLSDIEKINTANETAFACNMITNLFDKTDWRPTYYYAADGNSMPTVEVIKNMGATTFMDIYQARTERLFDKLYFFIQDRSVYLYDYPHRMKFSNDIENVYFAGSISYCMLQGAVSMGFKEIYLLGMDHEYVTNILHDGTIIRAEKEDSHFYKEHDVKLPSPTIELNEIGYQCAREYCEQNGIVIKNATRGGKLEVFERVDFDSLFREI